MTIPWSVIFKDKITCGLAVFVLTIADAQTSGLSSLYADLIGYVVLGVVWLVLINGYAATVGRLSSLFYFSSALFLAFWCASALSWAYHMHFSAQVSWNVVFWLPGQKWTFLGCLAQAAAAYLLHFADEEVKT